MKRLSLIVLMLLAGCSGTRALLASKTVPYATLEQTVQPGSSTREQVRAAVARAEQELGSLQVLVCNAGIAQVKLFTDTTDEDWRRMMAVDLDGAFYACRAVLPGMIHRKYGRILLDRKSVV